MNFSLKVSFLYKESIPIWIYDLNKADNDTMSTKRSFVYNCKSTWPDFICIIHLCDHNSQTCHKLHVMFTTKKYSRAAAD